MTIDRSTPYAWSGPPGREQEPLTISHLIAAGNMDARVAAVLWALMHRRVSVIVAAMPQGAGKTATLTAMLDLLPPAVERIYLRGTQERFEFAGEHNPSSSIMLINELSDHLPYYLWDEQAQQAFELLKSGYALAATMHAESAQGVVTELERGLSLAVESVGHLTAIVNLAVYRNPDPTAEPIRRIREITLVQPHGAHVHLNAITAWDPRTDKFALAEDASGALAGRLVLDAARVRAELSARTDYLGKLSRDISPVAMRLAVEAYDGPLA